MIAKVTVPALAATLFLLAANAFAEEFPFNVLAHDKGVIEEMRAEGNNVWIKLKSAHLDETITVRISDRNRDFYRKWFHGGVDLVSSGFRGNDVWSDWIQTKAKYVEYWKGDQLILHLERR